eukprot:TRINITY_DN30998_c0_g3_i1.p1 TRINITY_DN30998_c0_g3~~TRINITY_DN30998_c0_g3_i1.p1  ORF type:complete len:661 (+),score=67.53 TRINITY_DN30998_c0_g3_i1:93-1985(+)
MHSGHECFPGWGMNGEQMHHKDSGIPPDHWSITQADLRLLRTEIQKAIAEQEIKPTERDPFDPHDHAFGPNMYTVVDQYVKPLTKTAGGMSWALLRHPEGLPCTIFITHCWKEGVFEFIDKVLTSWPRGEEAAWCCIFANPQNLDISDLIKEPRTSPFAKALDRSSHMMVVPTSADSIYTRIWCAYEAHLAYTWNKHIFTALAPLPRKTLVISISIASACASVGLICGIASFASLLGHNKYLAWEPDGSTPSTIAEMTSTDRMGVNRMIWYTNKLIPVLVLNWFVGAACVLLLPCARCCNCAWHVLNGCGLMTSTWALTLSLLLFLLQDMILSDRIGVPIVTRLTPDTCHNDQKVLFDFLSILFLGFSLLWMFTFTASEIDRIATIRLGQAAKELRNGFEGSIQYAQSSSAKDKANIMADIEKEGGVEAVDRSITVLSASGLSTPSLRRAAKLGVKVEQGAAVSWASLTFGMLVWLCFLLLILASHGGIFRYPCASVLGPEVLPVGLLDVFFFCAFLALFLRAGPDKRAFLASVVLKIMVFAGWLLVAWILFALPYGICDVDLYEPDAPNWSTTRCMTFYVGPATWLLLMSMVACACAKAGLDGVAQCCGRYFAGSLAPSCRCAYPHGKK